MKNAARKCGYTFCMEEDSHGAMCNQFLVSQKCIQREKILRPYFFNIYGPGDLLICRFAKVDPQRIFILSKARKIYQDQYFWQKYGEIASNAGYIFHHGCHPPYKSSKMFNRFYTGPEYHYVLLMF